MTKFWLILAASAAAFAPLAFATHTLPAHIVA